MVFNCAWAGVAFIAVAFQCQAPATWTIMIGHCIDQAAFWNAIGAIDIVIEMFVVALPIYLLYDLQLPWNKKLSVISAFAGMLLYEMLSSNFDIGV